MQKIIVNIARKNSGEEQKAFIQSYEIEIEDFNKLSVLNILEEIYLKKDKTLAFFHHAACKQAACGKCMVRVNGKSVLACKELVNTSELLIEPYKKGVVRDLVCSNTKILFQDA